MATKQIDQVVQNQNEDNVTIITAIPVFLFDFYATEDYLLLPMSPEQQAGKQAKIYGPEFEYDDLIKLYQSQLESGRNLYLSNYGLGNAAYMHEAYARIEQAFDLKLIQTGCYEACNVYKLSLMQESEKE